MTVHVPSLLSRQHEHLLQQTLRTNLFAFVNRAFQELNKDSGARFHPNWHVQAMCHRLQRVAEGDTRRLLITVPPRHLKTICTSVALPAWLLGRQPGMKILSASYGHELAGANLGQLRRLMESDFYTRLFGETRLERKREGELTTTSGGVVKAVSVGGSVTGFGADLIIVDDLMKASEATSQTAREATKAFYEGSLATRINNKSEGSIVAIQQRLHEDDIAARLIATGTFEHLNLPAIAEEDETIALGKGNSHRRRKGEALFPQHEPLHVLEGMRHEMGAAAFSAQYQQNPVAPGGNRFRWDWVQTYDAGETPDRTDLVDVVQSWDTACGTEPSCDYSVCTTWGLRKDGVWLLLDVERAKLDYPSLKDRVLVLQARWRADVVLIELASSG